ncbi:hypothetical protein BJ165DRAFT_1531041 [Panaeolus papilionaceus]|nr:hypothetical protein BJ165DRAFT_1531041 [Panaeolus papilionaceus]
MPRKGQDTATTSGPSKRKRKATAAEPGDAQTGAKKSRSRAKAAGSLRKVLDMPFDVLLEIFGHLLPTDLLSLGRVSQEFKELVMSPGFKSIWVQSRSQIPDAPDCPGDITEPMFAELAFGKGCMMCNANRVQVHTLWRARTRLCTNCIADTFVSNAFIRRLNLPPAIHDKVPRIYIRGKSDHCCQKYAKMWADEYNSLKTKEEKEEWEKTKLEYLLSVEQHAKACAIWVDKAARYLEKEKTRDATDRKARILELAKSMGWAEELSKTSTGELPADADIDKICRKPLTDASIESAKVAIDKIMIKIRDARIDVEKRALYKTRIELLHKTYPQAVKDWMPSGVGVPYVSDIFIVPRIRAVVVDTPPEVTVTPAHFFDKDSLPTIVEEAKSIRKAKFVKILKEGYKSIKKEYDPATVTRLASTVFGTTFKHSLPDYEVLNVPQALSRKFEYGWQSKPDLGFVENIAVGVFKYGPWNTDNRIVFHNSAHQIICNLITLCGLDPDTTTVEEMKKADPILECTRCNSRYEGRLMLRWSHVASHIMRTHYHHHSTYASVAFLKIPNSEDVQAVRKAIKDLRERRAYSGDVPMQCKHCDLQDKLTKVRQHLFKEHKIDYPTDDDWKSMQAMETTIEQHRLWPPGPEFP